MNSLRPVPGSISNRAFAAVAGCVAVSILGFVVRRAAAVPFTYDEAAAYLRFVETDPLSVFNFGVATNHLLVTILTRLLHTAFGDSEFVLRLPSVFGYILFSASTYLIAASVEHRSIALGGFTLMHVNPYLLDFFTLSRGYGLAIGLLAVSLYFLLDFTQRRDRGEVSLQPLSYSLLAAVLAVMANFALLNAYLAIIGVVLLRRMREARAARLAADPPFSRWRGVVVPALAGGIFAVVIFSQDADLSGHLYENVSVRMVGLNDADTEALEVLRVDLPGRSSPLARVDSGWVLPERSHCARLRIEGPEALAARIAFIEVAIGDRVFGDRAADLRHWTTSSRAGLRVWESTPALSLTRPRNPAFQPVINWAGEQPYLQVVAQHAAAFLAVLFVMGGLLRGSSLLARRFSLSVSNVWQPIASSVMWVTAFAAPPLYVLERGGELHYGDPSLYGTFKSLAEGFFYGQAYQPWQEHIAVAAATATIALALLLIRLRGAGAGSRSIVPLTLLVSIMLLLSAGLVAQHLMFGTPYLFGRTALLYVPLYVLILMFLCDALLSLGPRVSLAAGLSFSVIVAGALAHFAFTANTRYALDWRDDAATEIMMGHVAEVARDAGADRVKLGVEPIYFPVAVFYAKKSELPIAVHVLPSTAAVDYEYRRIGNQSPSTRVIARYRAAGSLLASVEQ